MKRVLGMSEGLLRLGRKKAQWYEYWVEGGGSKYQAEHVSLVKKDPRKGGLRK